ncbi:MAG: metal ABC transporter ATP-binding protein [Prochlorococcaceae cyanobacterium]
MGETILDVSHLSVRLGSQLVVDDVSFALTPQSDTALVGPNGAGKSTLVQAVLGLIPRQQGSVRVLGQELGPQGELPPGVRAQIAYLPQQVAPRGRLPLTVAEFVALGWSGPIAAAGRRERREATADALQLCGCQHLSRLLLSELSAGQLKRVLLAFCVVRPRQLLLLDEPQAGLDVQATEHFHSLLAQLRRSQGWTILQVSHDLEMVRRSCDRVLCLNRSLRCSGAPGHALAPPELERLYGRGYVPVHHHHHGTKEVQP